MGEGSIPISVLLFPFCDFAKILLPSSPVCFRMEFILSAELAGQVHREGRNQSKKETKEERELHGQEGWAAGTQGAGCAVSLASPRMHQEVREEGVLTRSEQVRVREQCSLTNKEAAVRETS